LDGEDDGASGSGTASGSDEDGDVKMEEAKERKPVDPADMSAFKMDDYDEEESGGVGEFCCLCSLLQKNASCVC